MKYMLKLLSVLMLTVLGVDALAQKKNTASDYNLQKAYEVLDEEKDEAKALDLVGKQLKETPDNVEALVLRARLERGKGDYSRALQDINHALKVNKPKQSGYANSTLHWWKGYIYRGMGDVEKEVASYETAYKMARKDNRENLQSISFDYAQALFLADRPDESDRVYRKMLSEDEADQGAMVGLARNMIDRGQYREALEMLERCQRLDADYAEVYRFKMKAYDKLGEYTKAIDAGLDWFDKNEDADTYAICDILTKRPAYAEASLKTRAAKGEEPFYWKVFLCEFYWRTRRYAEAVKCYDDLESMYGHIDRINQYRSECYARLGLMDRAIGDISAIMKDEDPDWNLLISRGEYYFQAGDMENAVRDFSSAIDCEPSLSYPYYKRGWVYEMTGDTARAMEDYNLGIELDDDYPYLYLMRGNLHLKGGRKEAAEADFRAVLQKDTVLEDGSCRHYALHFLGKDSEAEEWMDRLIALDPEAPGNHYDKACLLARMGRLEESVSSLRTAFEKGFLRFTHIRMDDDMDPVRDLPSFKALVREYEAVHEAYLKEFELATREEDEETVTEIDMKRHPGGTFEIPCDINGLPLQMIFDTGASDVTISSVEANFMLKNGYLSEKDIKGKRYFQVASGQLSEGTVITLREVRIGDAVLHNIDASVVNSQRAPLLLGQSAMERFGTITIDNRNNKLIIKHR